MCGIFGYYTFGTPRDLQAILNIIFTGLRRLEYRGYDSAGLCVDSAEAPGRISTDGSSTSASPLSSANGSAANGAALDAALSSNGSGPLGGEPVVIKCPGKIQNLENLTVEYITSHVRALWRGGGGGVGAGARGGLGPWAPAPVWSARFWAGPRRAHT
jgi:asparagine synthetase B (glutamine-hydrolysing)